LENLILKEKKLFMEIYHLKKKKAEGMAQVVECLSSKWEALSSNLSTTNNKTGIRYTKAH
jgi:hypothetical protein